MPRIVFILTLLLLGMLPRAMASTHIRYDLRLDVTEADLQLRSSARAVVRIQSSDLKVGQCLYVPLHDPMSERIAGQQMLRGKSVQDMAARQKGTITWVRPQDLRELRPFLYQIQKLDADGALTLAYSLTLPGWKDREGHVRLMTQFYPQLLARCPGESEQPYFAPSSTASFHMVLDKPESWQALAPGVRDGLSWTYQGPAFTLVLYKQGQVHELKDEHGRMLLLYRSPTFVDLAPQLNRALLFFETIMGWRPSPDMLLVETDDFEPLRTPGLITLNCPQQAGMRYIQEKLLNWSVWQLAQAVAEQWFGLALRPAHLEDLWLVQGFADHLTLLFVETERLLGNLFVGKDGEEAYLRLSYRQAQDLLAALLSLLYPHNALVDESLESMEIDGLRPAYAFVRHSQALRYIHWLLKDPAFGQWLQVIGQTFRNQVMTPVAVLETLETFQAETAADDLRHYWQANVWPDFALDEIEVDPENQGSIVRVSQQSQLQVSFDVSIKTKDGYRISQYIGSDQRVSEVRLAVPPDQIERIELNPQESIYDMDRYNNSNRWPGLSLFPGQARTLENDAYTILWVPFASKLPGQALSVQMGWQMFRYVGSGLTGFALYQPEEQDGGYRLSYRHSLTNQAMFLSLSIGENDGQALKGERLWDLGLIKRPLWSGYPAVAVGTRLRFRQTLGLPEENHVTTAMRFIHKTDRSVACNWDLEVESEFSTYVPSDAFDYQRDYGILRGICEYPEVQLRARVFLGSSRRSGVVPNGALFSPQNLEEARIRLDRPTLPPTGQLRSLNFDLSLPARLPLPESAFVLPRRSQFRVFSDWGVLRDPDRDVQASGVGFVLPFGGDVMGKASVTLLQFSLYSVLYRRIGSEIQRDPGFIFDFTGDL